jgi:hypothetical protein
MCPERGRQGWYRLSALGGQIANESDHNGKKLMRNLSKSNLLAFRQCPKRLWLEVHHPDYRIDSEDAKARFALGNQVGKVAQKLYDPKGKGQEVVRERGHYANAFARTDQLLESSQPIFEAGFESGGAQAFADVMLPVRKGGRKVWRMIEVKSSTAVKDYHRDDVAIQAFVASRSGVPLVSIALVHIDSKWTYPGGNDYQGLLIEEDLTDEAFERYAEVKAWIADAQAIARKRREPTICTGAQCTDPFECGFLSYCQMQEPQAEYPVQWLPGVLRKELKTLIEDDGVIDMRQVIDELLNERQQRVKTHTLSGNTYFDQVGAAADLASHKLPACFLDFETIQFAVPIWKGTRPYQQIPFQFSLHRLGRSGKLEPQSFIDLSGDDPSKGFAEALIGACGERGPVFVYNAGFETGRIRELAERFPRLKRSLLAINERVVDLLPVARERYYHPSQQGSWSIKDVLPAIAPDLSYADLGDVQDGGMAMNAFMEATANKTAAARKAQIEKQLLDYCALDTYAMVRLWQFFSSRSDLRI